MLGLTHRMGNWLSLTEYSIKHKVSISTLRRRIKAEDIQFRLDEGKYLIMDTENNQSQTAEDRLNAHRISPSQVNTSSAVSVNYQNDSPEQFRVENIVGKKDKKTIAAESTVGGLDLRQSKAAEINQEATESVLTAANRLLSDLKKAYTQVLQEKEQFISDLREENSDLKTLIKVLESENDRLRDLQN